MSTEAQKLLELNLYLGCFIIFMAALIVGYFFLFMRGDAVSRFRYQLYGLCHDYNKRELDRLSLLTAKHFQRYDPNLIYELLAKRVPSAHVMLFSVKKLTVENYLPEDMYHILIVERDAKT